MEFTRTGFIIYVEKYQECLKFYRDVLKLPIMFDTQELTCFEFGCSYLMVELDDRSFEARTYEEVCLRMNVPDVKALADEMIQKGIEVDFQSHTWGTIAKFRDPAGNLCAFKDDEKFEEQIENYKT